MQSSSSQLKKGYGRAVDDPEKRSKDDQRYEQLPITQFRRLQVGELAIEGIYDKTIKYGEWHGKGEQASVVHCLSQ